MMFAEEKICAFFRKTWWETARQHLTDSERLALYEAVFSFQFEDTPAAVDLPPMVAMLLDLIKPTLTADKEKMQHRAEVARQNGAAGGRPKTNRDIQEVSKPSWLNENPIGYSGLALYNIQDANTIANGNVCVQAPEINEDTHTKFSVCVEFFLQGVSDAVEEGKLFWNYYDARGWKTGDGQPVKNVLALAKSWHPKDLLVAAAKRRAGFKSLFKILSNADYSLFERLSGVEIDNLSQTVFCCVRSEADAVYMEERYIKDLSKWVKASDGRDEKWRLEYRLIEVK